MKKFCIFILLSLCIFLTVACKNDADGGAVSSPQTQNSQSSEFSGKENLINSGESVENSENSDIGGDWTGIHSK